MSQSPHKDAPNGDSSRSCEPEKGDHNSRGVASDGDDASRVCVVAEPFSSREGRSREGDGFAGEEMPIIAGGVAAPPPSFEYMAFDGIPVVRAGTVAPGDAICDRCHMHGAPDNALFRPCKCTSDGGDRYFHRSCFRDWRVGWINPRNYFSCPDCMTAYRIERVSDVSRIESTSHERIRNHFRLRMFLFYFSMLLLIAALIGGIAGIAYGADDDDKNVPVGVKFMMTSVVSGWPPENATKTWREEFKRPDVPVWPYYTLLGSLCTAIIILILFAFIGCTFDENERPRRRCSDQCGCNDSVYLCYGCNNCYCPCDGTCDRCGGGGGGSGGCSNCDLKGGGELILIFLLVIIVIVLLSAVVVVILYAIKKWALFHDRMTDMMQNQARELESETIVLGIDETLRPLDAV